jgi:predicted DsbA family dithiol-disulfide isomerase
MESGTCRARAIAIDVATLRRQGVEPVPDFFEIAERYVSGALSGEQFVAAIEGLRHRQTPGPFRSPPEPASD